MRPILQSSCAQATSAAEARYRIDAPIAGRRGARVVALDGGAATVVRRLAHEGWNAARFFTLVAGRVGPDDDTADASGAAMPLHRTDGSQTRLGEELVDADVVVMVATACGGTEEGAAAAAIGRACDHRGIMTAGVVLGDQVGAASALHALRPYARVLLISTDDDDVAEFLAAIRA